MKHLAFRLLVLAMVITMQSTAMDKTKLQQDQAMIKVRYDSIYQRGPLSPLLIQLIAARKHLMSTMPTTPPAWNRQMPVSPP